MRAAQQNLVYFTETTVALIALTQGIRKKGSGWSKLLWNVGLPSNDKANYRTMRSDSRMDACQRSCFENFIETTLTRRLGSIKHREIVTPLPRVIRSRKAEDICSKWCGASKNCEANARSS